MKLNSAYVKQYLASLHQQLDLIARKKIDLFEVYEYANDNGVNLTANLLLKLKSLEFEEEQIQDEIVHFQKLLKKLEGGN